MVWIARNNLKTVIRMLSTAGSKISLPKKMICRRVARSYAWLGKEELLIDPKAARSNFWQSLKNNPVQAEILVLYLLSSLPLTVISLIRNFMDKYKRLTVE
jgi:hypothetical protein